MNKDNKGAAASSKNTGKKPFYKTRTAFFLGAVAAALLLSGAICLLANDAFALTADDGEVTLVITETMGAKDAAKLLKDEGLIGSRLWFRAYLGLRGRELKVIPGTYTVRRSAGFDGIYYSLHKKEQTDKIGDNG